jgi:hypothetical protein
MDELIVMTFIFWWVPLAIGVGYVADQRGYSGIGWFIVALLASAPLALLFLIAIPAGAMVDDGALRRNIQAGTQ